MTDFMSETEKRLNLEEKIVDLLIEEKCTVQDAQTVLYSIANKVRKSSTVQKADYWERLKDDLLQK